MKCWCWPVENIRRVPSVCSMSSSASASSITVLPVEMESETKDFGCKDFDSVSVESCGMSPAALHNIREQMALSLERTKLLEEQVKVIPSLQVGVHLFLFFGWFFRFGLNFYLFGTVFSHLVTIFSHLSVFVSFCQCFLSFFNVF